MHIGIIEVCEPNHYTAVDALAKTYATHPDNEVIIFTLKNIAPLFNGNGAQVVTKNDDESIASFLSRVASFPLDRVHINTISNYYKEFAAAQWPGTIYLTLHNIDHFLNNGLLRRTRKLLYEWQYSLSSKAKLSLKAPLIQFVKDFKRQAYRDTIMKNLFGSNFRIIVYGHSQKQHLTKMLAADKIIVFPFCINDGLPDRSAENAKLRICIPGSVSTKRRDYDSLFKLIQTHPDIRSNITFDILGYIPEADRYLVSIIQNLLKAGADILYSLNFIDIKDFDHNLSRADIILGNLKAELDPFQKYGVTKETGITFNIIKAGKPGILPSSYPVDDDLKDICLGFENYDDLALLLKNLLQDTGQLQQLKKLAEQKVKYYQPKSLYPLLVS